MGNLLKLNSVLISCTPEDAPTGKQLEKPQQYMELYFGEREKFVLKNNCLSGLTK